MYGDPNLLSTVLLVKSVSRSLYDELGVHFEHRFTKGNAIQASYTLAWGRGMGGVLEPAQTLAAPFPQIATPTVAISTRRGSGTLPPSTSGIASSSPAC